MASIKGLTFAEAPPEQLQGILDGIAAGASVERSCQAVGIEHSKLYRWIKQSKRGDASPELRKFAADIDMAKGDSEVRCLQIIANAAPTQWQAAAWLLERRFPDQYALRKPEGDRARDPIVRIVFTNDWRTQGQIVTVEEQGKAIDVKALPAKP